MSILDEKEIEFYFLVGTVERLEEDIKELKEKINMLESEIDVLKNK